MTEAELKARMKAFGLRVIRVTEALPARRVGDVIGRQLLRAGTSAGANYRSASRAKSTADFLAKLAIVEEELDESAHWLETIEDAKLLKASRLANIRKEAEELLAIVVASIRTARRRQNVERIRSSIQNPKSKIQNRSRKETGAC